MAISAVVNSFLSAKISGDITNSSGFAGPILKVVMRLSLSRKR